MQTRDAAAKFASNIHLNGFTVGSVFSLRGIGLIFYYKSIIKHHILLVLQSDFCRYFDIEQIGKQANSLYLCPPKLNEETDGAAAFQLTRAAGRGLR